MFNTATVAEEIFQTLVKFNFEVAIYGDVDDQRGVKVYEPSEATLFFTRPKNIVVSIHEMGENSSIAVHLGKSTVLASVMGMLDTLRNIANRNGINFDIDKNRRDLAPRDFSSVMEARVPMTGSTKSSYMKLEGAKMIVRHDNTIDLTKKGARSRNINKVFIESSEGERHLMPSSNLMAGRAMTRHISKGGNFNDERGNIITEMATEQMHAKTCASYCSKNKRKLGESVDEVIHTCKDRVKTIRKTMEGIYRNYDKASVELDKREQKMLTETDDEVLEEKINILKKKLKLEDEEIMDRPTCESIVGILGENEFLTPDSEMQTLNAIGDNVSVEKDAWENFKAGSLDLIGNPKVSVSSTNFITGTMDDAALKTLAQQLSMVAAALNPKTSAALANTFEMLSDYLQDGRDDVLFLAIAHRAVEIAAEPVSAEPAERVPAMAESVFEGLIMNEGVRALESWFGGFDGDSLFEDDMVDAPAATIADEFNVDDFLVMQGDDFGYGDDTIVEKVVDAADLQASLSSYLNKMVQDDGMSELAVDSDTDDVAKSLIGSVASRLEEEGYTVTGMNAVEGDDEGMDIDSGIDFRDDILDDILDEDVGEFNGSGVPEKTRELAAAIHRSGFTPRPYSGRAMYGKSCLGVTAEYRSEIADELIPALENLVWWFEDSSPHFDGMGKGVIAYWPHLKMEEEAISEADGLADNEEVLMGDEDMDDADLEPEDILMPSNAAADLTREIKSTDDSDKDDGEDDAAYINRLVSLAGVKVSPVPRIPQP